MPRLSQGERARRDAIYRVWVENELDFSATSAATGVPEKELERWARYHRWWSRWQDEVRQREQRLDEVQGMLDIFTNDSAARNIQMTVEEQRILIIQILQTLDGLAEELGDVARIAWLQLLAEKPGLLKSLVRVARNQYPDGRIAEFSEEFRAGVERVMVNTGLVTQDELEHQPVDQIDDLIEARLRQRGIGVAPQA